jgi:uncharacterized protein
VCGARLADDPHHQHDEQVDPRWSVLGGLASKTPSNTGNEQTQSLGRTAGPEEE